MRFVAALLVMWHHIYLFKLPTAQCWAWVEFFFILSGYFVTAHFRRQTSPQTGADALRYTLRRFAAYAPYYLPAVAARYLIAALPLLREEGFAAFARQFADLPFEAALLTSSGISGARLSPVWFLSAMFIVMPLFVLLLVKLRDPHPVWALLVPILYYGHMGLNTVRTPLNDMLRAFVGLTLGSALYYAVRLLRRRRFRMRWRVLLTAVEFAALSMSVYLTVRSKNYTNLLLISFSLLAVLELAGVTCTARVRGRFCGFLAKLSLAVYLFHFNIGLLLQPCGFAPAVKLILYYGVTLAASAVWVAAVEGVKSVLLRRRAAENNINLPA